MLLFLKNPEAVVFLVRYTTVGICEESVDDREVLAQLLSRDVRLTLEKSDLASDRLTEDRPIEPIEDIEAIEATRAVSCRNTGSEYTWLLLLLLLSCSVMSSSLMILIYFLPVRFRLSGEALSAMNGSILRHMCALLFLHPFLPPSPPALNNEGGRIVLNDDCGIDQAYCFGAGTVVISYNAPCGCAFFSLGTYLRTLLCTQDLNKKIEVSSRS